MGYSTDYIKQRTLEIYDSMPQEKEARMNCISERDEIIELNYKFFGYVASHTFINNSAIDYEDKFQSCVCHFCDCFWWYKWKGDETHKGYRQDLSFAVFFKPRLGEMIERELNTVKYSVRRSLCMEAGKQLGKHWAKVTYDDLKDVDLPADKMESLKMIFGSLYPEDPTNTDLFTFDEDEPDLAFSLDIDSDFNIDTDEGLCKLMIQDMLILQDKLDDSELQKMSNMYQIDFNKLKKLYPLAEKHLVEVVKKRIDLLEGFKP